MMTGIIEEDRFMQTATASLETSCSVRMSWAPK
jgi:hypothetical protein